MSETNDNDLVIKPIKRNPQKFDTIELFSLIGKEKNYNLNNIEDIDNFTTDINKSLKENITPTLLYGKRIEKTFAYVISSLGKCKIIKEEDSGEIFTNENIMIPDYRIILVDNSQFLVEVKNFNQKRPDIDYKISTKDFDKYIHYSKIMGVPLYFSIYWSKLRMWTLVSSSKFVKNGNKMSLSFTDATMNNKMSSLFGDYMIATTPPLKIRMYADKSEDRITIGSNINFTIEKVEVYCNSILIKDKEEQSIVWNLIMFGRWIETNEVIFEKDSNLVNYIDFIYLPDEYDDTQPFAHVGDASEIITQQYFYSTSTKDGNIKSIYPFGFSNNYGTNIKMPYTKKDLPLWIFYISTKDD